jgi:hypothetical protein
MKETVKTQVLLGYLQALLTEYMMEVEQFGSDDRIVKKKLTGMLACKSMVENVIGEPVNLGKNGIVTTGF